MMGIPMKMKEMKSTLGHGTNIHGKEDALIKEISLLALPVFIDYSNTDVLGKIKIEPVQLTLSIFKHNFQRNFHFWRTLGLISDLSSQKLHENIGSDGDTINHPQSDASSNLRDYHRVMCPIFQSLKCVQKKGGFKFELYYKGSVHELVMKPVLGPIIGDNEGQDKLVACYQTYGKCNRLCRYCDLSFEDYDNPSCLYSYIKQ